MTARSRRSISTSSREDEDDFAQPALECRRCSLAHPSDEQFCRNCGSPLVPAGVAAGEEISHLDELAQRARKIHPRMARGEVRRVAVVRNLAEGELIQGILLEEGIPSILRRCGGFDVPDMIAAGPRDVMVPESGVEAARALLAADVPELEDDEPGFPGEGADEYENPNSFAFKLAAGMLAGLLFFGAVAGAMYALVR